MRERPRPRHRSDASGTPTGRHRRLALPLLVGWALATGGCRPVLDRIEQGSPTSRATAPAPPPPPAEPPPPPVRDSLAPVYALLPRGEYARLAPPVDGVPVAASDADFSARGVRVSAADKLAELGRQIADERGLDAPLELPDRPADRERAGAIPFRGNPSDVVGLHVGDEAKLFVPLGGDLMTPGNEVAVVGVSGAPALLARLRVGVRPQRLAVDVSGLVFVCNQYSSYLSVIDGRRDALLAVDGRPVEIATDFFCTDLAVVAPDGADPDLRDLYVANRFRRSVLRYRVELLRDEEGSAVDLRRADAEAEGADAEIAGVGSAPTRLVVDEGSASLYVLNARGGRVARIELGSDAVAARFEAGAPAIGLARIGDRAYVPTLMPDRGLLAAEDLDVSPLVRALPFETPGLDGGLHVAHPGARVDGTRSYNFEDVRNGLFELHASLRDPVPLYYTDDVAADAAFGPGEKLLAGALPQDIARNAAGDRLYLALGGSDLVQELIVTRGAAPPSLSPGRLFPTRERPFALALDEERDELYVAAWGGEVVEIFDLASGARRAEVDLGYATPRYPASAVEQGERHFYDAGWSNNGRKSCAHCHFDELVSDGVAFSNGATAPTALHRVKPNHDLGTTDAYFWNGSFGNGSYRSLAFAAQTRTNCELVLFGLVEGPASDPGTRVGDPGNPFRDGRDAACRPLLPPGGGLPLNLDSGADGGPSIAQVIAAQKAVAEGFVRAATGLGSDELARRIDLYSASELRLPPNPLARLREAGRLPADEVEALARGEALFGSAGCAGCHVPGDPRHPLTNGGNRGRGADWAARFAAAYADDPRLRAALPGGLPPVFLEALRADPPSPEIDVHLDPIDAFTPFCFGAASCLAFEDPLAAGDPDEETRRLDLLLRFNLADPQRGFVPGTLPGQPSSNVPSLRGVWTQANLLHHGLAKSVREAILAPGHPALRSGERGYAVDALGAFDRHGATRGLAPSDVDALVRYVLSLE